MYDIEAAELSKIGGLISMLKPFGELTDCKFTNEAKTEAFIKFGSSRYRDNILDQVRAVSNGNKRFKVKFK